MQTRLWEMSVTFFYCQQLDPDQDLNRRRIEKEFGTRIKFFPLPCSGRIEPLHFLRAFEAGADLVYLITCPEQVCRYQYGNERAKKRVAYAKTLIQEIGLDPERLIGVAAQGPLPKRIDQLALKLLDQTPDKGVSLLGKLK
jgi:F420-non-reducing hydrogenase iron-sulfur subunit